MLKNIKIQNYKLFKDFSLKDLPPILLIGGQNNSGKTSLLEAMFMILDLGDPAVFMRHFPWRGVQTVPADMDSLFSASFYNFDLNQSIIFDYSLNGSKKKLSYKFIPSIKRFNIQNGDINIPHAEDVQGAVEISYGSKKAMLLSNKNDMSLDTKEQKQMVQYRENVKACFLSSTHSSHSERIRHYSKMVVENRISELISALQILEPNLKSLSLIALGGGVQAIYGDVGMKKRIPISLMGQGMNRLLSIMLSISEMENGITLIDELENGFHYSLLPDVWKVIASYAKENNTQVIATTHSRELASAAVVGIPEELKDRFKYMRLERKDQKFIPKMYNMEDLKGAIDSNLEIR